MGFFFDILSGPLVIKYNTSGMKAYGYTIVTLIKIIYTTEIYVLKESLFIIIWDMISLSCPKESF